ncbi:hypothetical protein ABZX73_06340 [Brevibacterium casei]
MRTPERPVWPILGWVSAALLVASVALLWVSFFVDVRYAVFAVFAILACGFSISGVFIAIEFDWTYEKKPRGWRELRQQAERKAYIEQLEKELMQ